MLLTGGDNNGGGANTAQTGTAGASAATPATPAPARRPSLIMIADVLRWGCGLDACDSRLAVAGAASEAADRSNLTIRGSSPGDSPGDGATPATGPVALIAGLGCQTGSGAPGEG